MDFLNNQVKIGFVSPSGGGKTTIVTYLSEKYGLKIAKSFTTRTPRGKDDNEYNFVTVEEFLILEKNEFFFEVENLFGNYYGTPKRYLYDKGSVIFNVDANGMNKLKSVTSVFSIMVLPPSIEILKSRIVTRDNKFCPKRINRMYEELSYKPDFYILNDSLKNAYKQADNLIKLIYNQVLYSKLQLSLTKEI